MGSSGSSSACFLPRAGIAAQSLSIAAGLLAGTWSSAYLHAGARIVGLLQDRKGTSCCLSAYGGRWLGLGASLSSHAGIYTTARHENLTIS